MALDNDSDGKRQQLTLTQEGPGMNGYNKKHRMGRNENDGCHYGIYEKSNGSNGSKRDNHANNTYAIKPERVHRVTITMTITNCIPLNTPWVSSASS